jgi:hypothetical protein
MDKARWDGKGKGRIAGSCSAVLPWTAAGQVAHTHVETPSAVETRTVLRAYLYKHKAGLKIAKLTSKSDCTGRSVVTMTL